MASVSRRLALIRTAAAAASADWLPGLLSKLHAYPLDMPTGCQTYPVRAFIAQGFPGTMKMLDDRQGVRSGGVLYKVSGPLFLDPRTGLVGGRAQDGARRPRRPGLEEDICGCQSRGDQELLRGDEPRCHEGQFSLSTPADCLTKHAGQGVSNTCCKEIMETGNA
jgi:hypothetical protein